MMSRTATTALKRSRSASTRRCTASTARSKLHFSTPSTVQSSTKHKHVRSKRAFTFRLLDRFHFETGTRKTCCVRCPSDIPFHTNANKELPISKFEHTTVIHRSPLLKRLCCSESHLSSFSNGNFQPFGSTPSSISSRSQPIQSVNSILFEA